jgi:hypothetical protein
MKSVREGGDGRVGGPPATAAAQKP